MKGKNNDFRPARRTFLRNLGILSGAGFLASCGVRTSSEADTDSDADGQMTYRTNPNTGDSVSVLGYGCMRYPTLGLANGSEDPTLDQEAINESIDYALAHGINYFDTSPAYCRGFSEAATGEALSRHPRESYFIATKLSNFAPSTWPLEKGQEMFENSLRNLRTDYVDYLLLHAIGGGGVETYNARYEDNGLLDWLLDQKKAGRIRNLGFSFHGDKDMFDHMMQLMDNGRAHWDFVQIQLNYLDWNHSTETDASYMYDQLTARGIPVIIMEPLLGGRLAKLSPELTARMKQRRPDDSPASWAFRFAGTPEGVLTVLSGMTYMDHLKENIATYSPLEPVSPDEMEFLERAALDILADNSIPCTDCKYCMPCPYGVDIPGVFAHYNKCLAEDNVPRNPSDASYAKARRAYLYTYDKNVDKLRQADRCVGCGACLSHCPQTIQIPERLLEIDLYTETLRRTT